MREGERKCEREMVVGEGKEERERERKEKVWECLLLLLPPLLGCDLLATWLLLLRLGCHMVATVVA